MDEITKLQLYILEKTAAVQFTPEQTVNLIDRLTDYIEKQAVEGIGSTVLSGLMDYGKLATLIGGGALLAAPVVGGYAGGYAAGNMLNGADEADVKSISDAELADEYDRLNNEAESRRQIDENRAMMNRLRAKTQRSLF